MSYISNTEQTGPAITPVVDRLAGKVAVVTGAARGIGKAIAIRFAQEGADVLIADKDLRAAQETASELQGMGRRAIGLGTDVTSDAAVEAMMETVIREFKSLDILVNNAGMVVFGSLMECSISDWEKTIAVDLTGAFRCTQLAGKYMIQQACGGRLIHIGSTASLFPAPRQGAYSVAKAGLLMMSKIAAMELAEYGITSNLICPHAAVTDINRELLSDPKVMARLENHIPAKRLATVEEIAAVAAFLASEESSYITGTELVHDGAASISGLWWR